MNWNEFTLTDLEAAVPLQIFERGIEYYEEGHLLHTCRLDNLLAGVLIGTGGNYKVRLWLDDSGLQGDCTCPYTGFCKHMAALAYGWFKDNSRFINLRPQVEAIITDTLNLPAVFLKLIRKDPISFLEFVSAESEQPQFLSTRGITNLIRNTFSSPYLTMTGVDSIWEKMINLRELVIAKVKEGVPEAPELILELLSGLEKVPTPCRNETWVQFFREFLRQLQTAFPGISPVYHRSIGEKLLALYFNAGLWDLAGEIRAALIEFNGSNPEVLAEQAGLKMITDAPLLTLILAYELLIQLPVVIPGVQAGLEKVEQSLYAKPDGLLWLIDRLMDQDIDRAFKLAKQGSRSFSAEKRSFRERQINIHLKRDELKQAAALSFIQFQEQPNFEEYLRLKNLLKKHPVEWRDYWKRLDGYLQQQKNEQLRIRVLLAEGDIREIVFYLNRLTENPDLLTSTAKLFETALPREVLPVYPVFIKALLARNLPRFWKTALQLMVVFKKQSHHLDSMDDWEQLRRELQREYQDNPAFQRKFGSILASS